MTAPTNQDSFEEWCLENFQLLNLTSKKIIGPGWKLVAKTAWNASRIDAEKKIDDLFKWSRCGCDYINLSVDGYKISCRVHKISWPILQSKVVRLEKKIEILTRQMEIFARMRWGYDKIELLNFLGDIQERARKALAETGELK